QLRVLDAVEIGAIFALHCLALQTGLEAPAVAFIDHLPQPTLLAPIAGGQSQFQPLAPGRIRIVANMDPLRAANKLGDGAARPSKSLGDLHTAGPTADDPPAFALIRHIVVPAGRVERRAGKTLAAGNFGKERFVQKAGGADEDVGNIGAAVSSLDM